MSAVLMDTHALIWYMNGTRLEELAVAAIYDAQQSHSIYVSPISAWEAALAVMKRNKRPNLGDRDASEWFSDVLKLPGVELAPLDMRIAIEAANVPKLTGRNDPGDCFIIATAHVNKVPVVTRDPIMINLAKANPDYLRTVRC